MRLIQFFQTGKKMFNDQILDNIRVKPSWVKLGERNPSLAAQKELAEIELRDPALFCQDSFMILLSIGLAP